MKCFDMWFSSVMKV